MRFELILNPSDANKMNEFVARKNKLHQELCDTAPGFELILHYLPGVEWFVTVNVESEWIDLSSAEVKVFED